MIKQGLQITGAIQVTYLLNNENSEREVGGLLEVKKELNVQNTMLIYYDLEINQEQIPKEVQFIPVWNWLLNKN